MDLFFIKEIDEDLYKQVNELSQILDSDIGPVVISQSVFHIGLKLFVARRNYKNLFPEWVSRNWQPSLVEIISDEECRKKISAELKNFSFDFIDELIDKANVDKHEGFAAISQDFRKLIFRKTYDFCSDLYQVFFSKESPTLYDREINDLCISKTSYRSSLFSSLKTVEELEQSISKDVILIETLNRRIKELELSMNILMSQIDGVQGQTVEVKQEVFAKAKNNLESIKKEVIVVSDVEKRLAIIKQKEEKIKASEQRQQKIGWLMPIIWGIFALLTFGGLMYLMFSPSMGGYPINHEHTFTRVTAWIFLIPMCINGLFTIPAWILAIYKECLEKKLAVAKGETYQFDGNIIIICLFMPLMAAIVFFGWIIGIPSTKLEIEKAELVSNKKRI